MTAAYRPILAEMNLTYPRTCCCWCAGRTGASRSAASANVCTSTPARSPVAEATGGQRVRATVGTSCQVHSRATPFRNRNDRRRRRRPPRRGPSTSQCAARIPRKGNPMKTIYTAEALTTGDGRDGHARSADGRLDLELAIPKEMGAVATAWQHRRHAGRDRRLTAQPSRAANGPTRAMKRSKNTSGSTSIPMCALGCRPQCPRQSATVMPRVRVPVSSTSTVA